MLEEDKRERKVELAFVMIKEYMPEIRSIMRAMMKTMTQIVQMVLLYPHDTENVIKKAMVTIDIIMEEI